MAKGLRLVQPKINESRVLFIALLIFLSTIATSLTTLLTATHEPEAYQIIIVFLGATIALTEYMLAFLRTGNSPNEVKED